jgi:hypothetical protein
MQDKRGSSDPMDADQNSGLENRPADIDQWLTEKLHATFDEIAAEPIPPSLLQLLEQLDKNEGGGS